MPKHDHVYGPVVADKDGKTVKYQACRVCGVKKSDGDGGGAGVREPRRPKQPAGAASAG